MYTELAPKVLLLTSAADTFTASADCSNVEYVCAILKVASSSGSTGSINLVLQAYDSTAASTGTSLTTLWGTSQMTAQLSSADKTFMAVTRRGEKGRYLYVTSTQADETANAAFVLLGFQAQQFVVDATSANVTKFVQV